jgi:hypothetical protein
MPTPPPERLPLTSTDTAAERIARLRELLPGAFAEGKVVPERLAELLGAASVSSLPERYGLSYGERISASNPKGGRTRGQAMWFVAGERQKARPASPANLCGD